MPRVRSSKPKVELQGGKQSNAAEIIYKAIEPAEVVDVIMDPGHPAYNADRRRTIGAVMARPLVRQHNQPVDNLQWYNPLNSHVSIYPLLGEIVLLITAPATSAQLINEGAAKYYMSIVNVWHYVNHNGLPASSYDINLPDQDKSKNYRGFTGNSKGGVNDVPFGETFEEKAIARVFPYEGDIIYEGRWGQSIRFGSTVSEPATQNDWSAAGDDGDPITIISNGHASEGSYHIENINDDSSGIYMCSSQKLPIDIASTNFDSYESNAAAAVQANREAVAGPEAPETPTGGGASSGGAAEGGQAAGGGGAENAGDGGDPGPAAETSVEPDAEIEAAVEELEEVGPFDAFRRGKLVDTIMCVVIDGKIVNKAFADKILEVKQAAQKDGVKIKVNSGFRPQEAASGDGWATSGQLTLRRQNAGTQVGGKKSGLKAAAGTYEGGFEDQIKGSGYFKPLTARAGYSNHQNGSAFDIQTGMGSSLSPYKETTKTWRWMVANMHKYGFIRSVAKERWHWEYAPGKGMFSKVSRDHGTWDNLV